MAGIPLRRQFSSWLKVDNTQHYPVMYREVQSFVSDYLQHRATKDDHHTYQMVDCTFGGGNHSVPLLR